MSEELKPCPFCEAIPQAIRRPLGIVNIYCRNCEFGLKPEIWNTRPAEQAAEDRAWAAAREEKHVLDCENMVDAWPLQWETPNDWRRERDK